MNRFGNAKEVENALIFTKKKNLKKRISFNTKRIKKNEKNKIMPETLDMELNDSDHSSTAENKNENNSNQTIIVKNLSLITTESDLEKFILKNVPKIKIDAIRIIRDRKGTSKGIAFIDFPTVDQAHECSIVINNMEIDDSKISCAVSKPPNLGANDLRTIFVNNISFGSTQEKVRSAFEKYGQILDIRIIYDKLNNRPKGFCYVEFADESAVNEVLKNQNSFIIDGRKVIVKRSQSVTKLRESIKFVAHITNLSFSLTDVKLKEFFVRNGIDKILDVLIIQDNDSNSKGFGFVEFSDEESLNKVLLLSGKIIRGRPICIKISNRNITRSNKNLTKENSDIEMKIKKKKIDKLHNTDNLIENENLIYAKSHSKEPEKLSNKDFRKFLK